MDDIKEKCINISPEPVSLEGTKKILNQMNKCVCRIYNDGEGTGFFTKIPFINKFLPVLITNNHILNENDIKNNKKILININKELRSIKIDGKRKRYTNEQLDITIIEIKEEDHINNEYIELDDNIMNYFKLNEKVNPNDINGIYCNKSIYILNYPERNDIVVSYGQPPKLTDTEISHRCSTEKGSSGSPILLIENQKLIGVHCGSYRMRPLNKGRLIIYSIIEFQKINNNLLIIDKEGKITINEINNYIIGEFDIKEENKNIRIINSYEQYRKEHNIKDLEKEYENEEEIKKCEIRINDEIIPFCYDYKFNKKGKYKIKYIFKENIKKIDFMFRECLSLTNIDLSDFNNKNIINMRDMFGLCSSLTNIDLSNFNTQNVTNMSYMFYKCSSLTNINLSDFNTQNVTNMFEMFFDCSSLTDIDLSNFNTQNVTNMSGMFSGCSSLTNIDLSNFNTQNVINMSGMFWGCSSLTDINLSNFNTQKITHLSYMFNGCSSLTHINLYNFNSQNVINMCYMFSGCSSLTDINLYNFNTQNNTDISKIFLGCYQLKKYKTINYDKKILNEINN